MKDEYKILLGAIIVILIVLVGAYALSGSGNPGPSASPTVVPVTATPTTVPGGGGSTGGTPSATPTVVPTATPAPTPTPEPESGVKLTEFGYWITYPPLPPQNWSEPKPLPTPTDIVYFDPISQTVTVPIYEEPSALQEAPQAQAVVHRDGDLSGTTYVLIRAEQSSNMYYGDEYRGGYWFPDGDNPNLVNNYNGTFTLRFDPGVSEQTIYIDVWDIWWYEPREGNYAVDASFTGTVTLTIVNADAPFTYGYKNQYTLTVHESESPGPSPEGAVVEFVGNSVTFTVGTDNGTRYDFYIPITRTGGDLGSPLPVILSGTGPGWGPYFSFYSGTTFDAGNSTTYVNCFANGGTGLPSKTGVLNIDSTGDYTHGSNYQYTITIEFPAGPQ
jgi:hypothetical protein